MAINATIFKAELQVSDMDRHYYATHNLTIARHPSETDERMMVRIVAFALNASEQLEFCKGLSEESEATLWQKNLIGDIEHWIDVGLPDESRTRKAHNQSSQVSIYSYGERTAPAWWQNIKNKVDRFNHLKVYYLNPEVCESLCEMVQRTMQIQANIQDGELWLSSGERRVTITPERWF